MVTRAAKPNPLVVKCMEIWEGLKFALNRVGIKIGQGTTESFYVKMLVQYHW